MATNSCLKMKISKERQHDTYCAIACSVMDARVVVSALERNGLLTADKVDTVMYHLEQTIWKRVCETLNIKED